MFRALKEQDLNDEDLDHLPREEITTLVTQLRAFARDQQITLTEIIAERDAALLLNELCHY